jgi:heme/copper-type cytochrome/quinol oxidase subunit 2
LPRLDRGTSVLPVTTFQAAQDVETYPEAGQARRTMMDGTMLAMGLIWVLVVVVLILSAAALIKYLRSGRKADRQ